MKTFNITKTKEIIAELTYQEASLIVEALRQAGEAEELALAETLANPDMVTNRRYR